MYYTDNLDVLLDVGIVNVYDIFCVAMQYM